MTYLHCKSIKLIKIKACQNLEVKNLTGLNAFLKNYPAVKQGTVLYQGKLKKYHLYSYLASNIKITNHHSSISVREEINYPFFIS